MEEIYKVLPEILTQKIKNIGSNTGISEIRLRVNKNCIVITSSIEIVLEYIVSLKDILDILIKVSKNSIYSIQNDINNGFIVINGGHRIGICGEAVVLDGNIKNIKNINSLNIRVAHQIIGCADKILTQIIEDGIFYNTLIVSPPGCGKTTLLRDIIRQISNGVDYLKLKGLNVGLVDERGEIASVCNGICNLDVGLRTDVMSNISKAKGIEMITRSMGVSVIATDEIGTTDDVKAINYAVCSGVSLIFTAHGNSIKDISLKEGFDKLLENNIFRNIIILSNKNGPGTIEKMYKLNNDDKLKNVS